jgi:hypothetical protein
MACQNTGTVYALASWVWKLLQEHLTLGAVVVSRHLALRL